MSVKKGRRIIDEVEQFTTLLGPRSEFTGQIEGGDNCIINGKVIGDCELSGVLVLGEEGHWQGNIRAPKVIISGQVTGAIVVDTKLELTRTARIKGSITSPVVAIEEGAVHEGEIRMQGTSEVIRFREKRRGGE